MASTPFVEEAEKVCTAKEPLILSYSLLSDSVLAFGYGSAFCGRCRPRCSIVDFSSVRWVHQGFLNLP